MQKAFPAHAAKKKSMWKVLEDNDPSGYKSGPGKAAKEEVCIITNDLPKRSPDLNVLDYCLWAEINKRMRAQEKFFPRIRKRRPRSSKFAFVAQPLAFLRASCVRR